MTTYLEWLNRAGIALGFFASIMIAPELIGLERLRNWERRIRSLYPVIQQHRQRIMREIQDHSVHELLKGALIFVSFLFVGVLGGISIYSDLMGKQLYYLYYFQILIILFILGFFLIVWLLVLTALIRKKQTPSMLVIMAFVSTPLILLFSVFEESIQAVGLLVYAGLLRSMSAMVQSIVVKMEGNDLLKSFLITGGLFLLAFAHLLQLVATFR